MNSAEPIDWRTVLMLPPQRRFSADELARAVPGPLSRTLRVSVLCNVALPVVALVLVFGRDNPWHFSVALLAFIAGVLAAGLQAWRNPSGRAAQVAAWALPLAGGAYVGAASRWGLVDRGGVIAAAMLAVMASLGLWVAIVHRHQYVQMRLAEMAERERALEMARRLAAAQLEPHFLFNTLASLQHWVQTKDDRAATLLASFTGYLRATLPMFARPTHPLADELVVVRRFVEVMQARFGTRLQAAVDIEPALLGQTLPPGLLLTLVENAIEHGIEPQLRGGRLELTGRREGGEVVIEVRDDGPGPGDSMVEGVGLANCRQRLVLTHGAAARLDIARAGPQGGCRATLRLPVLAPA